MTWLNFKTIFVAVGGVYAALILFGVLADWYNNKKNPHWNASNDPDDLD